VVDLRQRTFETLERDLLALQEQTEHEARLAASHSALVNSSFPMEDATDNAGGIGVDFSAADDSNDSNMEMGNMGTGGGVGAGTTPTGRPLSAHVNYGQVYGTTEGASLPTGTGTDQAGRGRGRAAATKECCVVC
jgi:hypothetical protein